MIDQQRFAATASAYDRPEPHYDPDLVLVGRGTPMGEMLRRYWHPVYKSDKLSDLPIQVRALAEDIILFRKPSGEAGAVYPRCIHRGTSLLWGKVTDAGIRCAYHGWTFEPDGRCTDQPCEPNRGGKARNAVRQPWYPVEERYGLVFVYLGPLDRRPPLPRYDLLEDLPDGWEIVADDTSIPSGGAGYLPCNWLQHHENGIDPAHIAVVHEHQFPPMLAKAEVTNIFETHADRIYGNGLFRLGPMVMDFKVDIILPNVRVIPDPTLPTPRPDGKSDQISWTLPKDDTDTMIFTVIVKPGGTPTRVPPELYNGKSWHDLSFEEHQRYPGDFEAQVGQGPITFHSEEHLVGSDKGVVLLRRQLQAAVRTVTAGGDPPLTFGSEAVFVATNAGVQMLANPDYIPEAEPDEVLPAPAATSDAAPASGTWALVMQTPMGDQSLTVALAQDGDRLTGTMTSTDGDTVEIRDGRASGGQLHWKAEVKKPFAMTMKFDVNLGGAGMAGKFKPGMFPSGSVSGVRV